MIREAIIAAALAVAVPAARAQIPLPADLSECQNYNNVTLTGRVVMLVATIVPAGGDPRRARRERVEYVALVLDQPACVLLRSQGGDEDATEPEMITEIRIDGGGNAEQGLRVRVTGMVDENLSPHLPTALSIQTKELVTLGETDR
jgi:hypothetical protein